MAERGIGRERRGDVGLVTISNPAKRNALDPELCRELAAAVAGLGADGARALVLTADGDRAFSAGFDVDALEGDDAGARAERDFGALIDAIAGSPVPIVCALNGAAFGGGLELAATCDLRVAHERVRMAMPPARLGLVYAPRGLARFSAILGEARARWLFLASPTLTAPEALAWGLIDEVVPAAAVLERALGLAGEIARLAPLAVQGMRLTFEALLRRRAALAPEDDALLAERRLAAWRSRDAAEARRAFADKRDPVFKGE